VQRPAGCPVEEFAALARGPGRAAAGNSPGRRPRLSTRRVVLVTTLLEPHSTPPPRWASCTCGAGPWNCIFREDQILLGMDVLRCQTPADDPQRNCRCTSSPTILVRVIMQQTASDPPCAADAPQLQKAASTPCASGPPRCTPHGAVRATSRVVCDASDPRGDTTAGASRRSENREPKKATEKLSPPHQTAPSNARAAHRNRPRTCLT